MKITPTIFFGHGSPMNAIEKNSHTDKWKKVMSGVERPKVILVISAHWQTRGTRITGNMNPETIHDFGGFPQELFDVQYPAKGDPELAKEIADKLDVEIDMNWGLDHGAWSVLAQIYLDADIPMVQLSLDINKTPQQHFELGQKLAYLREQGVMIIGSGNIVHNLGLIDWSGTSQNTWASEFNDIVVENIEARSFENLVNYKQYGEIAKLSMPTNEHYLTLLYVLGVSNPADKIEIFNNEIVLGSIAMTSVKFV
jgi:4,5-DOPA dioxygenase extradiol